MKTASHLEPVAQREPEPRWRYLPAVAGASYLMAWVAGLAAWPSNLALNASASQAAASHRAHAAQSVVQYVLVEGLAGVLFGVVLAVAVSTVAVSTAAGRRRTVWAWPAAAAGATAAVISVTQCVLGLLLTSAASHQEVARAGDLFGLVNRLDGVKMLLLGGAAVYLAIRVAPDRPAPRWLRTVAALAAAALAVSGVAYLFLLNGLAGAAAVSLPLLLAWITGTGIWLTRHAGRRA